jgi:hypothetical protein
VVEITLDFTMGLLMLPDIINQCHAGLLDVTAMKFDCAGADGVLSVLDVGATHWLHCALWWRDILILVVVMRSDLAVSIVMLGVAMLGSAVLGSAVLAVAVLAVAVLVVALLALLRGIAAVIDERSGVAKDQSQ